MLIVKDFGATCLDQTWTYVGAEKEVSERHQASEGKTLGCSGWKGEKASFMVFLAVHNSSIGDLVTHSLTQSLTQGTFTFDITE